MSTAHQYMKKTGTRRNALICTPHSLLELPDLRDSNKLCGVQIGIVEVVYLNDWVLFFLGVRFLTNFRFFSASDLSASQILHTTRYMYMTCTMYFIYLFIWPVIYYIFFSFFPFSCLSFFLSLLPRSYMYLPNFFFFVSFFVSSVFLCLFACLFLPSSSSFFYLVLFSFCSFFCFQVVRS